MLRELAPGEYTPFVYVLTLNYFLFRLFEFAIINQEDDYFKRATRRMLFGVLLIELCLAVSIAVFSNMDVSQITTGTVYASLIVQASLCGVIVSVIVANFKRKYPDGLYMHLWFKHIKDINS